MIVGAISRIDASSVHSKGRKVQPPLELADSPAALVEGRDKQEREQDLDARQRDAQLAHQFVQVAVVALELGLASAIGDDVCGALVLVGAADRGFVGHRAAFLG